MLLSKRAWDIVREDYPVVFLNDSLSRAMCNLRDCIEAKNGCLCALVKDERGQFVGAVSIWDTIRFLKGNALKGKDEGDGFEAAFFERCKLASSTKIADVMDKDTTVLSPSEPLMAVLEKFVRKGRSYAVVKEGQRIIGVIMISDVFAEICSLLPECQDQPRPKRKPGDCFSA